MKARFLALAILVGGTILIGLLLVGAWGLTAWSVMVAVGVAHNDWWSFIPPMGFRTAMLITLPTFIVSCFTGVIKGIQNKD